MKAGPPNREGGLGQQEKAKAAWSKALFKEQANTDSLIPPSHLHLFLSAFLGFVSALLVSSAAGGSIPGVTGWLYGGGNITEKQNGP